MNKVQILGTITKEIEVKYTQGGSAIASFGIAYNDKWKDQSGQMKEKAHFFDVTAFGKQAETVSSFFHKGSRILIDGSLDFQSWTASDGTKRSKVGIKLNGFSFIDRKSDAQTQSQPSHNAPSQGHYSQPHQATTQNRENDLKKSPPIPEIDIASEDIPFK